MAAMERMMTTREVAEVVGVHIETVRGWVRKGKLRAYRVSGRGRLRFDPADVRAVLKPVGGKGEEPAAKKSGEYPKAGSNPKDWILRGRQGGE